MLAEGQTIGSYRIVRKLGEGGMGAVFEAVHQEIGRRAAVKVLHPQFAQNAQVATRFMNEAKAANLIEHPGVVEIFEFSRLPDGTTYIVMEYLKGEPLAKRLERGPMGLDTLRIARQIASVLAAAHERGIIHRDLKPDNVIIVKDPEAPGGERAKVLDFGIAKLAEEHTMKTAAGSILGTPAYMAPEQCRGASTVTDKSDVYALGVMMYEMLSGHVPFTGEGIGEIMLAHLMKEPPPLREAAPGISGELAAYVHRLLDKDPAIRPTMREVMQQLEHLGAARTGVISAVQDMGSARAVTPVAAPDVKTIMGNVNPGSLSGIAPPTKPQTVALNDLNGPTSPAVLPVSLPDSRPHTAMLPPPLATPPPDRNRLMLVVLLGVIIIGVLAIVGLLVRGPRKVPPKRPNPDMGARGDQPLRPNPQPKNQPRKPKVPVPDGMVFVPGGRFDMGSAQGEIDSAFKLCQARGILCDRAIYERELPRRSVTVRDTFVDKTEVTNAQFVEWLNEQAALKLQKKRFINSGKLLLLDLDPTWGGIEYVKPKTPIGGFKVRDGFADKPVVQVTWGAAQRYCAAKGKRLPTEAEWEMAARGPERRPFPWGDEPPACDGTVFGRGTDIPTDRRCTETRGPQKVGSASQDKTALGILDLGGNVAEWVQDVFADHYPECTGGCKNPVNDIAADAAPGKKPKKGAPILRVVRGGHFDLPADACRSAGRSRLAEELQTFKLGFRCVRSLSE